MKMLSKKTSGFTLRLLWRMLLLIPHNSIVSACGGFFCQPEQPVLQAGENIAFGVRQASNGMVDVDMAIQINYEGPAEEFAWILPVPTQPNLTTTSDLLFSGLFEATRPTFSFQIDNMRSSSCTDEQLLGDECDFGFGQPEEGFAGAPGADSSAAAGAIVLNQGVLGPFNFVILEAPDGNPEAVFEWLINNGYDQPAEAEPLVTYYAEMDMKFVALRLRNDAESGLIRPVVLQYQLSADLLDTPVACIPIELTSIAATPDMPIQVYLLGPRRGTAYNYAHLEIDYGLIDWLGCQTNSFAGGDPQNCYVNSFRALVDVAATMDVSGHAFVTEYAGETAGVLMDAIAVNIDLEELSQTAQPNDFLNMLLAANIPDISLVHTVIERHIPNRYKDLATNNAVPNFCLGPNSNVYTPDMPWIMTACLQYVDWDEGQIFDPQELASDLDIEIFQPAQEAEDWVLSYVYISRFYAQLDPDQMDKDPLFAFPSDLPDVSNEINVVAAPVCDLTGPIALDVYVDDRSSATTRVPATLACGQWFPNGPPFLFDGLTTPALSMTLFGLVEEETLVLLRDSTTGLFVPGELESFKDALDGRGGQNQAVATLTTVPGSDPTSPPSTGPVNPPSISDDERDGSDGSSPSPSDTPGSSSPRKFALPGSIVGEAWVATASIMIFIMTTMMILILI